MYILYVVNNISQYNWRHYVLLMSSEMSKVIPTQTCLNKLNIEHGWVYGWGWCDARSLWRPTSDNPSPTWHCLYCLKFLSLLADTRIIPRIKFLSLLQNTLHFIIHYHPHIIQHYIKLSICSLWRSCNSNPTHTPTPTPTHTHTHTHTMLQPQYCYIPFQVLRLLHPSTGTWKMGK
jgi:hypothetical protein